MAEGLSVETDGTVLLVSHGETKSLANKSQPPNANFLAEKDAFGKQTTKKEAENEEVCL